MCLSMIWIRHRENLYAAYHKRLKFVSKTVNIIGAWIKLHIKKLRIINSLHKFYRSDESHEDKIETVCRTYSFLEKYVQILGKNISPQMRIVMDPIIEGVRILLNGPCRNTA